MDARELPADITELAKVLENVDVLGRVLPDQKKAIVQALHLGDHVVAMTGDGVNDALAIKEADLGIAMGNAAPATKAVAQVVLVDSKFSHLPDVVARGRQVMANMERVASLFLVKTVYSALISLGVVLTQIPFPYLPRHITYIGALTIGMPAFILALAPNTRRYIPGFLRRVVHFALPGGIATALSILADSWLLPKFMGWDAQHSAAQLGMLRGVNAIILLMMGIFVLARVAQSAQLVERRSGIGVRRGGRGRHVHSARRAFLRARDTVRRNARGDGRRACGVRHRFRAVPVVRAENSRHFLTFQEDTPVLK